MARISRENLDYCSKRGECLDCHSQDKFRLSTLLQKRGRFKVPCCKAHFFEYKNKVNKANVKKYDLRSAARRKAGLCVYPGCQHKLIPQEILPLWWKRESTCGMHGTFKAFRVNRTAIVKFLREHCLSPGQGDGMLAQHIIYHAGEGYVLFGLSKPNVYLTKGFSASDLLNRYEQFRERKTFS